MSALARTPKVPRELVGPFHQLADVGRLGVGIVGHGFAQINIGGAAVHGNPVALFDDDGLAFHGYGELV